MSPRIHLVYDHPEAVVVRTEDPGLVKSVISKTYAFGGEVLEVKPLKFGLEDYLLETMGAEPVLKSETRATKKPVKKQEKKYVQSH